MNGEEHGNGQKQLNIDIARRLEDLEEEVKEIKENHLSHLQESVTAISVDLQWLKKFFWSIVTPALAAIGTGIMYLVFQIK